MNPKTPIDPDIHHYRTGACFAFAEALHRLTNLPIKYIDLGMCVHAFVLDPVTNIAIDIHGAKPWSEFAKMVVPHETDLTRIEAKDITPRMINTWKLLYNYKNPSESAIKKAISVAKKHPNTASIIQEYKNNPVLKNGYRPDSIENLVEYLTASIRDIKHDNFFEELPHKSPKEQLEYIYCYAQCDYFAVVVNLITNFNIMSLEDDDDPIHRLISTPEGELFDASGFTSLEKLTREYDLLNPILDHKFKTVNLKYIHSKSSEILQIKAAFDAIFHLKPAIFKAVEYLDKAVDRYMEYCSQVEAYNNENSRTITFENA